MSVAASPIDRFSIRLSTKPARTGVLRFRKPSHGSRAWRFVVDLPAKKPESDGGNSQGGRCRSTPRRGDNGRRGRLESEKRSACQGLLPGSRRPALGLEFPALLAWPMSPSLTRQTWGGHHGPRVPSVLTSAGPAGRGRSTRLQLPERETLACGPHVLNGGDDGEPSTAQERCAEVFAGSIDTRRATGLHARQFAIGRQRG
jgi:hypothetical protein